MSDPPTPSADDSTTYDAFISYSRVDVAFAAALERRLEQYSAPRGVGPGRRLRIFRDEGDLAGPEYGAAIQQYLERSRKLIVVGSPDSRASEWVDDEIKRFLDLRSADDVVTVLLRGIPNNEGEPGDPEHAFPAALTEALGIPLAASFTGFDPDRDRPDRGRFTNAWYTILANLFDVTREVVEERDRLRRVRTLRRVVAAASVLVLVLSGLTVWALVSAAGERRARLDAEARLLEARAVSALAGEDPMLTHPVAALLMAREALAMRLEAFPDQRLPAAEGIIHSVLATLPGEGLAGWQDPIPRQVAVGSWTAEDPSGRWLVTGDLAADFARVWDLDAAHPGTTARLLEDTHAAFFLGGWLLTAGEGGLRARQPAAWDRVRTLAEARTNSPRMAFTPVASDPTTVVVREGDAALVVRDDGDSLSVVNVADPEDAQGLSVDVGASSSQLPRLVVEEGAAGAPSVVHDLSNGATWTIESARGPARLSEDWVVASHIDGGTAAWDLSGPRPELVHRWPELDGPVEISGDHRWLLAVENARLHTMGVELELGEGLALGPAWANADLAFFTRNGRWLVALGLEDHRLLDLESLGRLGDVRGQVSATAWVDGEDVLYAAHWEREVRRWVTGAPGLARSTPVLDEAHLASLVVSPDERWILTELDAGRPDLWHDGGDGFGRTPEFDVDPDLLWELDWRGSPDYRGLWDELGYYRSGSPAIGGYRASREMPFRLDPASGGLFARSADGGWLRWSLDDPAAGPSPTSPPSGFTADSRRRQPVNECPNDPSFAEPAFSPDGTWITTSLGAWRAPGGRGADTLQGDPGQADCTLSLPDDPEASIPWPDRGGGTFPGATRSARTAAGSSCASAIGGTGSADTDRTSG